MGNQAPAVVAQSQDRLAEAGEALILGLAVVVAVVDLLQDDGISEVAVDLVEEKIAGLESVSFLVQPEYFRSSERLSWTGVN